MTELTLIERNVESKESGIMVINQRPDDGYINATELCKAGGKLLGHYLETGPTKEFLNELSADIGIPISGLVKVRKGGNEKKLQGTWVHPDVAVHLAQWVSAKFAVQVSRWVREWMTTGAAPSVAKPSKRTRTKKIEVDIEWVMRRSLAAQSQRPMTDARKKILDSDGVPPEKQKWFYARDNDTINLAVIGETKSQWAKRTGLPGNPRDHASMLELRLFEYAQTRLLEIMEDEGFKTDKDRAANLKECVARTRKFYERQNVPKVLSVRAEK